VTGQGDWPGTCTPDPKSPTLRAAVKQPNADLGDTIIVPVDTYRLEATLQPTSTMTISGASPDNTFVHGGKAVRVLAVGPASQRDRLRTHCPETAKIARKILRGNGLSSADGLLRVAHRQTVGCLPALDPEANWLGSASQMGPRCSGTMYWLGSSQWGYWAFVTFGPTTALLLE
jgi:hypothetical protein